MKLSSISVDAGAWLSHNFFYHVLTIVLLFTIHALGVDRQKPLFGVFWKNLKWNCPILEQFA